MLMVDIAVPRDIDPAAAEIKDVYVYSIDDLQRIAEANLAKRREAIDHAWQVIREGTAEIGAVLDSGGLRHMMRKIDEHGRAIYEAAIQRAFAKEKLAALPEATRDEIRALAQKIVSKMLAEPRESLKRAAKNGDWDTHVRVTSDLFGFDRKTEEDRSQKPEVRNQNSEAKSQ